MNQAENKPPNCDSYLYTDHNLEEYFISMFVKQLGSLLAAQGMDRSWIDDRNLILRTVLRSFVDGI